METGISRIEYFVVFTTDPKIGAKRTNSKREAKYHKGGLPFAKQIYAKISFNEKISHGKISCFNIALPVKTRKPNELKTIYGTNSEKILFIMPFL